MSLIKNIHEFLKQIFRKKDSIKKKELPVGEIQESKKLDFTNSIKVNIEEKGKVETLICPSNGLGIQTKIEY